MKNLYYGWIIVGIALVILALAVGSVVNAFGVFVLPVSEEFGLSRADTNTALILVNVGAAIFAPFMGRMLDYFPVRRMMAACAILMGASFVTLGLSRSLLLSAAVITVPLAIAFLGAGTVTATVLVARWFTVNRGRAMAIALTGMGLGGVIVAPLIAVLVEQVGWREALVVIGCTLAVTMLLLTLFIREAPGPDEHETVDKALAQAGSEPPTAEVPLAIGVILRSPLFWMLGLSTAFTLGAGGAIMATLIPLGMEQGLGATQAAGLISIMNGAAIAGKLLVAWLGDRVEKAVALAIIFALAGGVNVVLFLGNGFLLLAASCLLLGLVMGAIMPIFLSLLATCFGPASFGTSYGLMTPLIAAIGAVCVRYAGEVFDRTGGYDALFLTFAFCQLLIGFVTLFARQTAAGQSLRLA